MYDEATRVGMDYVIQQASQRGIRLVLVLANYWAMYGGIDQYNIWSFQAGSGAPCGRRYEQLWQVSACAMRKGSCPWLALGIGSCHCNSQEARNGAF